MKQYFSIFAFTCACACSAQAQQSPSVKMGVYGRSEFAPKNDGFLDVLLPEGGEVSTRGIVGLSLTRSFSTRWQLRFEPGCGYTRYTAPAAFGSLSGPLTDIRMERPLERATLYDKNYLFTLHLPVTATYYIVKEKLLLSTGVEASFALLNYHKAAYLHPSGEMESVRQKDLLPAMHALNMPVSVGYQFRLSQKTFLVEPGLNLCLSRQSAETQNTNRYSFKLAYYF